MKKQSYKTFLINEIQRLTDDSSRSLSKWASKADARGKAAIIAYMLQEDQFIINTSNKSLKLISFEALKIKIGGESEFKKDAERYKEFYANYLERLTVKKWLMEKTINKSTLSRACKELGISYGNAFNFFFHKKQSYLTEEKATSILLYKKQYS